MCMLRFSTLSRNAVVLRQQLRLPRDYNIVSNVFFLCKWLEGWKHQYFIYVVMYNVVCTKYLRILSILVLSLSIRPCAVSRLVVFNIMSNQYTIPGNIVLSGNVYSIQTVWKSKSRRRRFKLFRAIYARCRLFY